MKQPIVLLLGIAGALSGGAHAAPPGPPPGGGWGQGSDRGGAAVFPQPQRRQELRQSIREQEAASAPVRQLSAQERAALRSAIRVQHAHEKERP